MPAPDPHDVGRLWLEESQRHVGPVAGVAPVRRIDKVYSFAVPPELAGRIAPGQRVRVRMGRRGTQVEGFCVEIGEQVWEQSLRPIEALVDEESYLSPALLELGQWISRYYCCPLGPTLAAMVPKAVRQRSGFFTRRSARLARPLDEIVASAPRIGARTRSLLEVLARSAAAAQELPALLERVGASPGTARSAAAKGWIEIVTERLPAAPPVIQAAREEPAFQLNTEQRAALDAVLPGVEAGGFRVSLLYGVSGSGKTEVYVRAMRRALALGKQAIMLVPEIALTTQLVGRLAARFERVAVIHSGLSDPARSLYWQALARGEIGVVIGTRSAVFAPCPNLGLIVIDEEQESSYKNLKAPRFHVRDVAIKRAQLAGIPVLLGSATPSLETWHNCERFEHYRRVDLPRRVRELPLPHVTLVRTDPLSADERQPALSGLLQKKLAEVLARGEQAVILINRRGFAWGIRCPQCGWRLVCPHCSVPMVFHAVRAEAMCHYCGERVTLPGTCPMAGCRAEVARVGAGTQRVEEEVRRLFPKARLARADSDSLRRSAQYQDLVDRFAAREIDVLVGTQMIAKGLDFPFVSLVGVIGADLVATSDFRVAERLFQLVTQVAGRAGRADTAGEVVVQSLTPEAPVLRAAMAHDFPAFAEAELELRRRIHFPPFARLARFILADPSEKKVSTAAREFAAEVRRRLAESAEKNVDVLGPQPCAIARLRDQYRWEALLRGTTAADLQRALEDLRGCKLLTAKVKSFVIDVDPVSML